MIPSTLRRLFTLLAFSFVVAVTARGQLPFTTSWEHAPALVNTKHALYVVTIAQPNKRHQCLVQSINTTEIVCVHHGHATTYKAEDVAALISPGTHTRWYLYAAGFLAASGAAAWVTVVLGPTCVPCAAAAGVAAFFLFLLAPASAMVTDGDSPDELVYLAPGQTLKVKMA